MSTEEIEPTQEVVDENVTPPEGEESTFKTVEDAVKELKKVRKEAASYRVKKNEIEEKAAKWEEHVNSQKTDLEKLTEEKSQLAAKLTELERSALRSKVALETKLDPDLVQFLDGTEDEMKAKAELLVSKAKAEGKTPDFYAGNRGTHVNAKKPETLNEWFADLWKQTEENSSTRRFSA